MLAGIALTLCYLRQAATTSRPLRCGHSLAMLLTTRARGASFLLALSVGQNIKTTAIHHPFASQRMVNHPNSIQTVIQTASKQHPNSIQTIHPNS
jgi:hypothetical protein